MLEYSESFIENGLFFLEIFSLQVNLIIASCLPEVAYSCNLNISRNNDPFSVKLLGYSSIY